jgi:hypothetical protein
VDVDDDVEWGCELVPEITVESDEVFFSEEHAPTVSIPAATNTMRDLDSDARTMENLL